jgi:hypothetical protein
MIRRMQMFKGDAMHERCHGSTKTKRKDKVPWVPREEKTKRKVPPKKSLYQMAIPIPLTRLDLA